MANFNEKQTLYFYVWFQMQGLNIFETCVENLQSEYLYNNIPSTGIEKLKINTRQNNFSPEKSDANVMANTASK